MRWLGAGALASALALSACASKPPAPVVCYHVNQVLGTLPVTTRPR